jgi:hypothetical protein
LNYVNPSKAQQNRQNLPHLGRAFTDTQEMKQVPNYFGIFPNYFGIFPNYSVLGKHGMSSQMASFPLLGGWWH